MNRKIIKSIYTRLQGYFIITLLILTRSNYVSYSMKTKTLIIPIGIVGCGKTTLAKLISKTINIAHIQNDDIQNSIANSTGVKKRKLFSISIFTAFKTHDYVFADRNNHLRLHRTELIEAFKEKYKNGRIVILDWKVDKMKREDVFRICMRNIKNRGEDHQTLVASNPKLEMIVNNFYKESFPFLDEYGFVSVVELSLVNSIEVNLQLVLDELNKSTEV